MKPFERHLWLFLPLIWQHVIRATSWLPSVFRFQRLVITFKLNFPTFLTYHTGFFRSVWNGDAVRAWCWMGTGLLPSYSAAHIEFVKTFSAFFSSVCSGDGRRSFCRELRALPWVAVAAVAVMEMLCYQTLTAWMDKLGQMSVKTSILYRNLVYPEDKPVVLVRVFSRFLLPSCDFHVPVFRSSQQSWCETFFERIFECREYQCLLFCTICCLQVFSAANYIGIFIHFHVLNWLEVFAY